jgi:phospholipase C
MTHRNLRSLFCASTALFVVLHAAGAAAQQDAEVAIGPPSSAAVQRYVRLADRQPQLSHDAKLDLLRQKVKYVFVIYQENRSFDFHFGTFPGADGLFSKSAAATAGFTQQIVNVDGSVGTISPFLIPQTVKDAGGNAVPLYPADTDTGDNSHAGINNSLDFDAGNVARNDRYALNEEGLTTGDGQIVSLRTGMPATSPPKLADKQKAQLVMSHIDCDTVPFLWQYAGRFTLFDNFHQTIIGPSTPNAIALIAGQSGETQWALHPAETGDKAASSEPVVADPGPFPGSNLDQAPVKPPFNAADEDPNKPAPNQTYASLPLSFMGNNIEATVKSDQDPARNLRDVQNDIKQIASDKLNPVSWGWYQEGYGHEPTDGGNPASHKSYIVHHNGPQYFGYVGDNPAVASNMHGLSDFFSDIAGEKLPAGGGVFYVRAALTISMAWSRSTPIRRCGEGFSAMTIIRDIRTRKSRRPSSPRRSTRSRRAPTGRRAPSSSPMTRPTAFTITPYRTSARSIMTDGRSRVDRGFPAS